MQPVKAGKVQSAINVTPLVDVVLVLLIIFMVVAPQLAQGPDVDLPTTERPEKRPEDGKQILVALEHGGAIWIDGDIVDANGFSSRLERAAAKRGDWPVVIQGDARLTYGEVRQAMLAIEAAGFKDVGLIAEARSAGGE